MSPIPRSIGKINDILSSMRVAVIVFFAAMVPASAASTAANAGYVVRVDSRAIYLDFGAKNGAVVGRKFEIYTEGPELTRPRSGESLGPLETEIAEGIIERVWPLYSTGKLVHFAEVSRGMRARLIGPLPFLAEKNLAASPQWESPVFDFKGIDFAVADFKGDHSLQTAFATDQKVFLYDYPPISTSSVAAYAIKGDGSRILSVSASDIQKIGRAQLFVSYYDAALGRVATRIIDFSPSKKMWRQLSDIPYLTRGISEPHGKKLIVCQELIDNQTFPFSAIYPLVFQNGSYQAGASSLPSALSHWIYAQGHIRLSSGQNAAIALDSGHRLQFHSAGKFWTAPGSYGQSPVRLRWPPKSSRLLEFSPRIAIDSGAGGDSLFLVRNQSDWGILSEAFGVFNKGQVVALSQEKGAFKNTFETDLPGYVSDIEIMRSKLSGKKQLSVFWVMPSDQSQLWVFDL